MNDDDYFSRERLGRSSSPIECRLFRFDMMKGSVRDKF